MGYKDFPCGCRLNVIDVDLAVSVVRCGEAYALWEKFRVAAYDETRFRRDEAGKKAQEVLNEVEEAYYQHTGRHRWKNCPPIV